ncbi:MULTISPECIES: type II toxin-antitoxin system RelE/ParE family toxin [Paraburkholderia]|nr:MULTISPECIES: type II toxin-antitoxin system RelE/ParE family toxin [Paraburkholderia]
MIKTFRHKGLAALYLDGSRAGIQPHHASRLRILLTALDQAMGPQDMKVPCWRLHALSGDLRDHWAVWVNGNWRLTFTFEGENAILLDYQDYH